MSIATSRQLWFLFTRTGGCLELRTMGLSKEKASSLISALMEGHSTPEQVRQELRQLGAIQKKDAPLKRDWAEVWQRADIAGQEAAKACTPTPMVVGSPTTPLGNDIDYSKPTYSVNEGVCGFAWVRFKGNTSFGRWAKKTGRARSAYGGGLQYWVSQFGQSLERKAAYARAFAKVLNEEEITAYAESRMD